VLGTAAIVVASVGSTVALTRDAGPVSKAATTLGSVSNAQLVSPTGVASVARAGQRVPFNYVVRTARSGNAELITRGRVVYVGGNGHAAAVAVVNGARQQLRTGTAVVDAQHGPGLQVEIAGDTLAVPDDSAVEATRSVAVTVGALVGPSSLTNSSARSLTIPALSQVLVSGDALPTQPLPLLLSDRGAHVVAAEAIVVPDLVRSDLQLQDLAAGIDDSGPSTANVVLAAWSHTVVPLPTGTPRSEQVLPIAIAGSTSGYGDAKHRYDLTVAWRGQGGSWGVVVAKLGGSEGAVAGALNHFAGGQPPVNGGPSLQQLAAPSAPQGHQSPNPHHSTPPTHPTSPPPTKPGHPTPSPTPTQGTVDKTVDTVGTVVKKVIGLLPTVLPAPKSTTSPGLLGGLLGH
jgi:hypothetical protein